MADEILNTTSDIWSKDSELHFCLQKFQKFSKCITNCCYVVFFWFLMNVYHHWSCLYCHVTIVFICFLGSSHYRDVGIVEEDGVGKLKFRGTKFFLCSPKLLMATFDSHVTMQLREWRKRTQDNFFLSVYNLSHLTL